jgi:putative nucleotidyltransferase with HDIG domain
MVTDSLHGSSCESARAETLDILVQPNSHKDVAGRETTTMIADGKSSFFLSNGLLSLVRPHGSGPSVDAWPGLHLAVRSLAARQAAYHSRTESRTVPRRLMAKVYGLTLAVERHDPYTCGHQRRVASLAATIAREMGLAAHDIDEILVAGLIHDVGKIYLPPEILAEPGYLSDSQMSLVRTHPQAGYEALRCVNFPRNVANIVLQHHERMDGSGYPHGLRGANILPAARIVAVADVVEAAVSDRPYRPARSPQQVLDELLRDVGVLFDPQAVHAVRELIMVKGYDLRGGKLERLEQQIPQRL